MTENLTLSESGLSGKGILLEALSLQHLDGMVEVVKDGKLWLLQDTVIPSPENMKGYILDALLRNASGNEIIFAIIDRMTRRVVGSTRYRSISYQHKRAVIGPTFLGLSWQGSHANTESKYLMLKQAFEDWKFNRIELLCDVLNTRSRNAIKKLGAREEGIIRAHRVMPDDRVRDSVVHSIIADEWPVVKHGLVTRLKQYGYPLSA